MTPADRRARRAAKSVGLWATRARGRKVVADPQGQFRLVDRADGHLVAGERFDLSPEQVIEFCRARAQGAAAVK